jgi:hypothetical protein
VFLIRYIYKLFNLYLEFFIYKNASKKSIYKFFFVGKYIQPRERARVKFLVETKMCNKNTKYGCIKRTINMPCGTLCRACIINTWVCWFVGRNHGHYNGPIFYFSFWASGNQPTALALGNSLVY